MSIRYNADGKVDRYTVDAGHFYGIGGELADALDTANATIEQQAQQITDHKELVVKIRDERDALSESPLNPTASQKAITALTAENERLREALQALVLLRSEATQAQLLADDCDMPAIVAWQQRWENAYAAARNALKDAP